MNMLDIVVIGVAATATADLWQQALKRFAGLSITDWRLVGRWLAQIRHGSFAHTAIHEVAPTPHEHSIGWAFHYFVGIVYAGLYMALLDVFDQANGLVSALAFALATVTAPLFIMQPALGLGIAARRAANRPATLLVTFTTHAAFGVGLYWAMSLL